MYGPQTVEITQIIPASAWKPVLGEEGDRCTINFMSHVVRAEKNDNM